MQPDAAASRPLWFEFGSSFSHPSLRRFNGERAGRVEYVPEFDMFRLLQALSMLSPLKLPERFLLKGTASCDNGV
jgi:hypothetical protein